MKKIVILSLFILGAGGVFAQSGLGVKVGVNTNNIYTDAGSLKNNIDQSLATKTGFVFGVFGRLGDNFYLQPELVVATRGGKVEITPAGGGAPQLVDVKYTNLDIPVLIGFKPVKFLRINGGPVASLKLSEDKKLKDALSEYTSNSSDAFANSTWGYQFGVGVNLLGFELDLRKEGSLTDISVLKFQNESKFNQRASGWQVTIAKKIL